MVILVHVCTLTGTVIIFIISGFHNNFYLFKNIIHSFKKTFAQFDSQVCSCHCCETGNGSPAWRMYSQLSHHEGVRVQCNIANCTLFESFVVCSLWIYLFHNVYQPVSGTMWEYNIICSNFHQSLSENCCTTSRYCSLFASRSFKTQICIQFVR